MLRRLAFCLALLGPISVAPLVAPTSAVAQTAVQLTADERAGLEARVAEINGYVDAGQFEAMADLISPRLLSTLAEHFGVDEVEARAGIRAGGQRVMSSVTIIEYEMDVDGARAFVTPDGSRRYALVDLSTVMEAEGTPHPSRYAQLGLRRRGGLVHHGRQRASPGRHPSPGLSRVRGRDV